MNKSKECYIALQLSLLSTTFFLILVHGQSSISPQIGSPIVIDTFSKFSYWHDGPPDGRFQFADSSTVIPDLPLLPIRDGVWYLKAGTSPLSFVITLDLSQHICEQRDVEISLEYHSVLSTANLWPVNEYDFAQLELSPSSSIWNETKILKINWETQNKIVVNGMILPKGCFVFASITITYSSGFPIGDSRCTSTTITSMPTTSGATETAETEDTTGYTTGETPTSTLTPSTPIPTVTTTPFVEPTEDSTGTTDPTGTTIAPTPDPGEEVCREIGIIKSKIYYACIESVNWYFAWASCRSRGLYLAEFHSEEEFQFVQNSILSKIHPFQIKTSPRAQEVQFFDNNRWWIGGNDEHHDRKFRWFGGGSYGGLDFEYTNWAAGQPNSHLGSRESCVEFQYEPDSKWNDADCILKMNYICYADTRSLSRTFVPITSASA